MASMAAKQVESWNKLFPLGTPVRVYRIYQEEKTAFNSKTRSAAWVMGGHSAMVMVEGQAGGHCLTHLEPLHALGEVTGQANIISVDLGLPQVTYLKANDLIPEREYDFTVSGDQHAVSSRIARDFASHPHCDYTVAECGIQQGLWLVWQVERKEVAA